MSKVIMILTLLIVTTLLLVMPVNATLTSSLIYSGDGYSMGSTNINSLSTTATTTYSNTIFGTGAVSFSGTDNSVDTTRTVSGTSLSYRESVGYSGYEIDLSACNDQSEICDTAALINYHNINSGVDFVGSGSIATSSTNAYHNVGFNSNLSGYGTASTFSNIQDISGSGVTNPVINGKFLYSSSYTTSGKVSMTSSFKYTW